MFSFLVKVRFVFFDPFAGNGEGVFVIVVRVGFQNKIAYTLLINTISIYSDI
jgi:hypothetical protein